MVFANIISWLGFIWGVAKKMIPGGVFVYRVYEMCKDKEVTTVERDKIIAMLGGLLNKYGIRTNW